MQPFYEAIQPLFAGNQRFVCRYFKSEQAADDDASKHDGGYVICTSRCVGIWRSTFPL